MRLANLGGIMATIARSVVIGAVAMLCVVVYTAGSLRRLAIRDRHARAIDRARQRGRLLRWSFSRLGASFIKVGQVMSARADLLAPQVIDELSKLQDRVPPFAFRHVRRIVERELGVAVGNVFRELDQDPIAAGSIAQVHRGVLHSGDEVAIKVLRPHVHATVRRDARLLLWLAHLAQLASRRARAAEVVGHTKSLVAGIVSQTDLGREAENYDRFRADFMGVVGLAFPRVYHRYSTRAVLTMELVHGAHLERVRPEHVAQVTRVLRDTFFAMCFEHGLVHADLHPGNVLVRDDGTVVVLDVGLVKHLDPDAIQRLLELSRCLVLGSGADLVAHLRTHHRHAANTDWDAVAKDAMAFMTKLRRCSMAELELSAIVGELFALARKHQICPMPEFSLVLLGMVTIEGIAKRLDPQANTLAEIARYLGPRIAREGALARGSREWIQPPITAGAPSLPHPDPVPVPESPVNDTPPPPAVSRTRTRTRGLGH